MTRRKVVSAKVAPFAVFVRGGIQVVNKAAGFGKKVGQAVVHPFRHEEAGEQHHHQQQEDVDGELDGPEAVLAARASVLGREARSALSALEERDALIFKPGEAVLRAGAAYERALYSLNRGELLVSHSARQIGKVRAGEMFGHSGFLLHEHVKRRGGGGGVCCCLVFLTQEKYSL
jgi:hypothetical protein